MRITVVPACALVTMSLALAACGTSGRPGGSSTDGAASIPDLGAGGGDTPDMPPGSVDKHRILFLRSGHVMTALEDDSDERQVTPDGLKVLSACWSPNGAQVAFVVDTGSVYGKSLHVIGADGQGERTVLSETYARGRSISGFHSPSWSLQGTIVFHAVRASNELMLVPANASDDGVLGFGISPCEEPAFSPDGATVVCTLNGAIRFIDATEPYPMSVRAPTGFYASSTDDKLEPAWFPTGDKLVVAMVPRNDVNVRLYTVDSEGHNPTVIPGSPHVSTGLSLSPSVSADGTRILFNITPIGGTAEVNELSLQTGTYRKIIPNATQPRWQP